MITIDQLIDGIMAYMDKELLSKMGWQRWLLGTGISLYSQNAREIFEAMKNNELIKMLGVINDDQINIDKVHQELKNQARKGPVTIELPMGMGKVTLNEMDVEMLHNYIKRV